MRMDLTTAQWLVDKMQNDLSVFPVEFNVCEKCGASYIAAIPHVCKNTIDIPMHPVKECDKIEYDWIPVSKELPESETKVEVSFDDGEVDILYQCWKKWEDIDEALCYLIDPVKRTTHRVIAWRPRPMAYAPQKEEIC